MTHVATMNSGLEIEFNSNYADADVWLTKRCS